MNDCQASDSFHHGVKGELTKLFLVGLLLIIWPMAAAIAEDDTTNRADTAAFDFHCEKRACQFWLTDPSLMLSSGVEFEWRLGDGTVSDKPAPLHHYPHDGHFRPELIVRRNDGNVLLRSGVDLVFSFDSVESVGAIGTAFSGTADSEAGFSVAGLGDFNASGLNDLIIGAPRISQGEAYVVFGADYDTGLVVPLSGLDGSNGFRITGGDANVDSIGTSVASLGAISAGVNRAVAFGAPGSSNQGPAQGLAFSGPGQVGVVYGSGDTFAAEIGYLGLLLGDGSAGFGIIGPDGEAFGVSVASAGDFNRNGFEDIVIGAPQGEADSSHPFYLRGRTYVIFGQSDGFPASINVDNLGPEDMLVIEGAGRGDQTGWSVAGIGDFNGNGFSDIIIGAPFFADPPEIVPGSGENPVPMGVAASNDGAAFVVFGGDDFDMDGPTVLDGNLLDGAGGFTIRTNNSDQMGFSVAAVADLNANSSTDLAVSAPFAPHPTDPSLQGAVHVLFGGTGAAFGAEFNPQASLNGSNGFSVVGLIDSADFNGSLDTTISVAGADDINGDGFDDLLIGLPGANGGQGRVVVIFGRSGTFPAQIDVSNLQAEDGFVINNTDGEGRLGQSVAGLGDFVGNGLGDLVAGAPGADGSFNASWVVHGQQTVTPPLINGGDGIVDQQAAFTSLFEIEFEVSDQLDASEDLIVQAFSLNPDFLPDEALTVGGAGATRTLTVDTNQAAPGSVSIMVMVTNTSDLTTEAEFTLQIVEQPPLINEGQGFDEQALFAGQPLEIEFTVSDPQDPPEDIQVTATSQTPNLIPPDGISILGTGGTRTLRVETVLGEAGIGRVDVEATNSFGLSTVEELVIVIDATPAPIINDGAGIDDQEMTSGESLEIDFTVDDPEFGPDAIDLSATSGDTAVLPSEQLSILGSGTNRTLLIETFAGDIGTTPITIEARNALEGEDSVTFNLTIAPAAPLINEGAGFDSQEVFSGATLEIEFTVSDLQDPPEDIQVTATSQTPNLIPPDGVSILGTGGTRTLRVETVFGESGTGQVDVEATNSFGASTVEELVIAIDATPAPIINDGAGIDDQEMTSGESLEIDFTVDDPEFGPDAIDLSVTSGDTAVLPSEQLSILGSGTNRTLLIETFAGDIGTTPITIEARNDLGGEDSVTFNLTIAPAAPSINEGAGFASQEIFAGEGLEIEFTVSDLQDPPEDIQVIATSQTPDLIPPEGVSILGTGGTRTLRFETPTGQGGIGQVDVEATNSFGVTTVEEIVILIKETPVPIINDGAGIDDREMTAGESLEIDFTVDDPEFGPDGIDLTATSGDPGVLPSEQLSILGSGTNRILLIQTFAGNIGTTPITIEARNPPGGVDTASFDLTIVAAPPTINDGQPIDDDEVRAGESLTIDFLVSDPLDPGEALQIVVESSNPELIPVEAISIVGTGNERTMVIETQPGTQGQSLITITVINSNGQEETREFLVEVFLLPTDLDLAAEPFLLPGFPDLLLRLSAANIGDEPAFGVLLAADIPEPFEAIGVFIEAQGCLVEAGAVSCDDELLPEWECSLFEGVLVCQLEKLEAEREAGVVLRIQGTGQADMVAVLDALNAPEVSAEVDLDL